MRQEEARFNKKKKEHKDRAQSHYKNLNAGEIIALGMKKDKKDKEIESLYLAKN